MKLSLADGVFMVACDEDIVVLDTRSDLYSCLPEANGVLTVGPGTVEGPEEVLRDLSSTGLLGSKLAAPRRPIPTLPRHALRPDPGPIRLADDLRVFAAMTDAWRRGPGRRPLADLLPLGGDAATGTDPERVSQLTAAFARRLPWDPWQGACLHRAWLLRRILSAAGETPIWVFGVRTWPFGAHCWLQIGDLVLDDVPDRVGQYAPIMAV